VKLAGWLCVAAAAALPAFGWAQQYPAKPIRVFLSTAGGGENNARIIAERAAESLGVPFVLEVNGAAGGSVAVMNAMKAEPDGYTVLYSTAQTVLYRPYLVRNTPYQPVKHLTPVAQLGEATQTIAASMALPAASFGELIEYARRNPGKISYASNGIGTTGHLTAVLIERLTGIHMVHVPYKAGTQALPDLMAGRVQLSFAPFSNFASLVEKGKLRMMAVTQGDRLERMPDVPLVAEILPGYEVPPGWVGMLAPAGLPAALARRLSDALVASANLPDVKRRVGDVGLVIRTKGYDEFSVSFRQDYELVGRIIRASGVEPD
jgi:tripartite-type tricarboxylate transporter receptor subunit TctC